MSDVDGNRAARELWNEVKQGIEVKELVLGPYFAHQALRSPRHLLFTLSRYKFVAKLLPQARRVDVLELGCGEGLGTVVLAEGGHRVTAIDFDEDAIAHASRALAPTGIRFVHDAFLGKRYGAFDAVASLDVIEHIPPTDEREYIDTVARNLAPHGFCVIGTPNITANQYASKGSQIGHVNLFDAARLTALMETVFHRVFVFGMNDEVVHTGFAPMTHYLMAVGCDQRAASISTADSKER